MNTMMTKDEMMALARQEAAKHGLRPEMFLAQLQQESGWNPTARSKAGAVGVAQFMPGTAKDFGIDPMDPAQAIPAAARYMQQLMARYGGSEKSALQAYNWGMGNVDKFLSGKKTTMPAETASYATAILGGARPDGVAPTLMARTAPVPDLMASAATPGGVPAIPMQTPAGPRMAVPSTSEEANLFAGLGKYPAHVQEGMANVLAQLLPARDMVNGRNLFGSSKTDMTPSLPSDYDDIIKELIEKA